MRSRSMLVAAILLLATPAEASRLPPGTAWLGHTDTVGVAKLMLAAPGEGHPVLLFISCVEGSGVATITVETDGATPGAGGAPVSLRAGQYRLRRHAILDAETPTRPHLRFALPMRHRFWQALAAAGGLTVASPALAMPERIKIAGLAEPLARFRRACGPTPAGG